MFDKQQSFCTRCDQYVNADHWKWEKDTRYKTGGRWRCKTYIALANKRYRERVKSDPQRHEANLAYHRQYHVDHCEIARYKSMKNSDKLRGFQTDVSLESYRDMIKKPCYYCGINESGGLDRMYNDRGHIWGNIVPCCEKRNNILGDIPFDAKEKLKSGLHQIRQENLLQDWIIPTKRQVSHV